MTVETKEFITPFEIRAIRIECAACAAAYTFPIDRDVDPPANCRSCGASWFPNEAVAERDGLSSFVSAIALLTKVEARSSRRLKLELNTTAERNE